MVSINNGDKIYILSSSYDDGEEEYGVNYIVGMFLSEEEAENKAEELKLGMYGLRVFECGKITVHKDVE